MAKEIKLPEVSDNVEAGDVVKVLVKAGDKIEVDQPIIELETDKAMFEVPASEAGTVAEVMVKEGDNIKVGSVILTVEGGDSKEESGSKEEKPEEVKDEEKKEEPKEEIKEDKKPEENETEKDSKEETASEEKEESKSKETAEPKEEDIDENKKEYSAKREPKDVPLEESPKNEGNKSDGIPAPASPSVRRLARELGVDINDVQGSGTGGRISDEDVKAFVKGVMQGGGATVSSAGGSGFAHKPLPDFSKWGETETEKMSNVRRVTAEGLSYAWGTTPMVTQFDEADITELEAFRKKNAPAIKEKGGQLTVTAILLKVVEAALRAYPQFNASIDMQKREIVYKKYFNIGIAADTDRGLLVPVIKEVDKKSLTDLSIELSEISEKARDRKITPEEMDGGNFTISNLGGIGGTGFTPIVYSPQVAILGVSRASYKPVYKDGEFVPRFVLPLGLTYDHRIIDGADAARFLRWICNSLEQPMFMLL